MNSKLVTYTNVTNKSNPREYKITRVTIHHNAGVASTKDLTDFLARTTRQVSANYVVGNDGGIGLNVPENRRAWTSSSPWNDHGAVTIEVANSTGAPEWKISDKAMKSLINLVTDICKRNGISKLHYDGTPMGSLTLHEMFANTNCPGPYIKSKLGYIQDEVNKGLGIKPQEKPSKPAPSKPSLKPNKVVAQEVIDGKWGNGGDRKVNLEKAGYNYTKVQNEVNNILYGKQPSKPAPAKKTVRQMAQEVIDGKWGSGNDRKNRLTRAGYDYNAVQNEVNNILYGSKPAKPSKTAKQVAWDILNTNHGWGNGNTRKQRLEKAGYNYNEVQRHINNMLRG